MTLEEEDELRLVIALNRAEYEDELSSLYQARIRATKYPVVDLYAIKFMVTLFTNEIIEALFLKIPK